MKFWLKLWRKILGWSDDYYDRHILKKRPSSMTYHLSKGNGSIFIDKGEVYRHETKDIRAFHYLCKEIGKDACCQYLVKIGLIETIQDPWEAVKPYAIKQWVQEPESFRKLVIQFIKTQQEANL